MDAPPKTELDLRIRAPRAEDAEGVAELLRACDTVIFGEPDTDVLDVRDDWSQPGFDLARDAWLLEGPDGALRGYGYVRARDEGRDFDGDIRVLPGDPIPALAPMLLKRIEARVEEKVRSAPAAICFFAATVETEMREVLEAAGYERARTFFRMRIDLEKTGSGDPPPSPGIQIRSLRLGKDDRAIHAVIEESFAEHFRHTPRPFEDWWALRARHERFDPDLFLLAWDGDQAAGGVTAYDFGEIGFIRELGVRAAWRGKGLATALLLRSFDSFRARGQLRVALGVDAENESALGLYRRVGMREDSRHDLLRRRLNA
jgi:mycothiol synthase